MNRHQRRAAAKREYLAGVNAMVREVQGVIKFVTVRPEDYLNMLTDMVEGRTDIIPLAGTVADLLGRVSKARDTAQPLLCAACPAPLTGGFAVIVASSNGPNPVHGLGMGVCTTCGTDLPSIEAAAVKGLRGIWPDLRAISVHPEAGHA